MDNYKDRLREETLTYMEEHKLFARKQITKLGLLGDESYNRMWITFTRYMLALGFNETTENLQKLWTKMRLDNKQTMCQYLKNCNATGNMDNETVLTDMDVRISRIFGKYGTGTPVLPEVGIVAFKGRANVIDEFEHILSKPTW